MTANKMTAQPATILKADDVNVENLGGHVFTLNDVLLEAKRTVVSAKQEAAAILIEAKKERERILVKACEEGHREGFQQGRKDGEKAGHEDAFKQSQAQFARQQATLLDACREAIQRIDADRAEWLATARHDLVELAVAIARRVAHAVGQREADVVRANIEEAVRLAGRRTDVSLHVNPKDVRTAEQFAPSLIATRKALGHVEVVDDANIAPGGCEVHWGTGAVDARLITQLERIAAELGVTDVAGIDTDDTPSVTQTETDTDVAVESEAQAPVDDRDGEARDESSADEEPVD